MYNGVLALSVAEEATLFGFSDDQAVVITSKHPGCEEVYAAETVRAERS